jgi:hypothetical protein
VRFAARRRSGGAHATYAGILDGRHLWLTLDQDGTAELRDTDKGKTLPLAGEVTDLLGLLPVTDAAYDVVLAGEPVTVSPFRTDDPIRVPVSPDGGTQLSLVRTDDGHLRVQRRAVAPTALLEAIELNGGEAHLTLRPPGDVQPGTHLLLLDADDEVLDVLPVTAHDGHVEALIGVADLPAGYFGVVRLALGTESEWVRIRRRRSDLVDAHRAVLLPELHDAGDEGDGLLGSDEVVPRARFRWNPDSLLVLRVLEPADLGGPDATVTPIGAAT